MDLSTSVDAAYAAAADTENTAIQIEARIVAFGGRPLLRQYGKRAVGDLVLPAVRHERTHHRYHS